MCGIVGFTGKHQAAPILLDGLSRLEYRGYDSAGIAIRDGEKETEYRDRGTGSALRTDPVSVYQLFQPCFFWRGWRVYIKQFRFPV